MKARRRSMVGLTRNERIFSLANDDAVDLTSRVRTQDRLSGPGLTN